MSWFLAFDGGGTTTQAGLYAKDGTLAAEIEGGPSNPTAYGAQACAAALNTLANTLLRQCPGPLRGVAAGLSGINQTGGRQAMAEGLSARFGGAPVRVTDDIRPLLAANAGANAALMVIAGTGSSVLSQNGAGTSLLTGGWGALLGDSGGAYALAERALRAAARAIDGHGPATDLAQRLPAAAGAADMTALAKSLARAPKDTVAALAPVVAEAAQAGDEVAFRCVNTEAALLAQQTVAAWHKLALAEDTRVFIHGGMFQEDGPFVTSFAKALLEARPGAQIARPAYTGHAAVYRAFDGHLLPPGAFAEAEGGPAGEATPLTEQAKPGATPLDTLSTLDIARTMNAEDATVAGAVEAQLPIIADVIDKAAAALRAGGRIIYAGAGTSGRLGVLDASECPPTFGVAQDRVIGLMAGGEAALRSSVEASEDDEDQAGRAIARIQPPVGRQDIVIGITASGTAPYVRALLRAAAAKEAHTVLLCCNPDATSRASQIIAINTGPEVLPGSTRLKAGTATKMVLNMISTGAMARAGYIYEGRMVHMRPINTKLRRRAVRIIHTLTGLTQVESHQVLEAADWHIATAILMAKRAITAPEARRRLEAAEGFVGAALQGE